MRNRILKTELVEWRKLKWFQTNLKELTKDAFDRLKNSLKNNSFIMPFNVWDDGKELWILDGHHRQKAMEELEQEGIKIPDKLPANFIECKSKREAAKLVLIYSSIYARVTDEGLYEFINSNEIDFNELKVEIDIPHIDVERFEVSYLNSSEREITLDSRYEVVVECQNEQDQKRVYNELIEKGYKCRVLTL